MKNATKRLRLAAAVLGMVVAATGQARAGLVVSTGAGSAVASIDRTATFSSLVDGSSLLNYTEGNLIISTAGNAYEGFDPTSGNGGFSPPFHYASGGAFDITTIKTTDAQTIFGLEFNVGSGYGQSVANYLRYEEVIGGSIVDSGTLTVTPGTVLGFRDISGFDELRVGAYLSLEEAISANDSSFQAIALDNLKVDLHAPVSAVPEPSTIALACSAVPMGLGFAWKRRRKAVTA